MVPSQTRTALDYDEKTRFAIFNISYFELNNNLGAREDRILHLPAIVALALCTFSPPADPIFGL